jgi:outer membrane receptor protein involved in Fe transport
VAEIQLTQGLGDWSAALLGKYVEEYESNAFGRCTLPGGECSPAMTPAFLPIGNYSTLDFTLSRDVTLADVDMKLTFSARNLTDENYETSLGYPNPGRMLGIELLADF